MKLFALFAALSCILGVTAKEGTGEVVFITGASSGIGYAASKYLASRGYKVAATARRKSKLDALVAEIKESGGEAVAIALDVVDEIATADAIAIAESQLGPINHFFLNAGVFGQGIKNQEGLDKFPMGWAKKTFDINVIGVLNGFKHGVKALRRTQEGEKTITLVSSIAGSVNAWMYGDLAKAIGADITKYAPYAMTKAAIDMLSRAGAHYKHEGIRVYNLKPGVFDSEMVVAEAAESYGGDQDAFAGFNPIFTGIAGKPIYIAHALEHFMDGSTLYPPGSNVVIDNDATANAHTQYATMENPSPTSFTITPAERRGLDGGEYKCADERTCARVAKEKEL